jgi:two-component system, cell cycle sensor histidine kinase and response regulator CckA
MTLLVVITILAGVIAALVAYARRRTRPEIAAPATPVPPATADVPRAVEHGPAPAGTVLVVEDDEDLRALTQRILERAGLGVLTAASASGALEAWRAQDPPIDVVLSDVVMPGASGVDLAMEITALSPGAAIVLISGFTPSALEQHRLLSDSIANVPLLQKPVAPADLVAAVHSAIASGRARTA